MYYSSRRFLKIFLAFILVGGVIFLCYILFHEKVVTTGESKKDIHIEYTVCSSSSIKYPFFSELGENATELKINVASENGTLVNIGLFYELTFQDVASVRRGYDIYPGEINLSFVDAGYSDDAALNKKFSTNGEKLFFSLYAEDDEIDLRAAPYFLLKTDANNRIIKDKEKVINNYKKQGFTCMGEE